MAIVDTPKASVFAILTAEKAGTLTGRALVDACTQLGRALQEIAFDTSIPETVWHYLADADIRLKDERYAVLQLPVVEAVLNEWKSR